MHNRDYGRARTLGQRASGRSKNLRHAACEWQGQDAPKNSHKPIHYRVARWLLTIQRAVTQRCFSSTSNVRPYLMGGITNSASRALYLSRQPGGTSVNNAQQALAWDHPAETRGLLRAACFYFKSTSCPQLLPHPRSQRNSQETMPQRCRIPI